MKLKNHLILSALCISILGIAGCARYQARPLDRLAHAIPEINQENTISYSYRIFNNRDCKRYLDRDVLAKGYQPIHITITNNTNHSYNLSLKNFNIACIDPQEVANKVHTSTAKRVASYGIGSLFMPILIIPAVVDGIGSSEANQQLDSDFDNKALESQIIQPYATTNGIIFTPVKNFNANVAVTLLDTKTEQKIVLSSQNDCVTL